jgi:RimJ/RimL family protein N-acetyltransferase
MRSATTSGTRTFVGDAPVHVRAMRPDDRDRLLSFHHALSAETVYLRFFSVHPELQPAEVERFTCVDHEQREAIVALVDDEIIGVARFDRDAVDTDTAEVAFVVADAWQGKGLGGELFARLATRAREVGIHRFVADTLPRNERMLGVFRHCGYRYASRYDAGVVGVELDLDEPAVDAPRRPHRSSLSTPAAAAR